MVKSSSEFLSRLWPVHYWSIEVRKSKYYSGVAVLSLAGCIYVSDEKIINRIRAALPFGTGFTVDAIEKQLSCLAATFTLGVPSSQLVLNNGGFSSSSSLGFTWHRSSSVWDYIESQPDGSLKSSLIMAVGHGSNCFKELGGETKILAEENVAVTFSRSGGELLVVFPDGIKPYGIYLAGG